MQAFFFCAEAERTNTCNCAEMAYNKVRMTRYGGSPMTPTQQERYFHNLIAYANHPTGFVSKIGLRITKVGAGTTEGELVADESHLNPMGVVHGGVLCSMMDHVAGTASTTGGSGCLTINCETRFLAAAMPGRLIAKAETIQSGRSIGVIRAWVEDLNGTVCAEGTYTMRLRPLPAEQLEEMMK